MIFRDSLSRIPDPSNPRIRKYEKVHTENVSNKQTNREKEREREKKNYDNVGASTLTVTARSRVTNCICITLCPLNLWLPYSQGAHGLFQRDRSSHLHHIKIVIV